MDKDPSKKVLDLISNTKSEFEKKHTKSVSKAPIGNIVNPNRDCLTSPSQLLPYLQEFAGDIARNGGQLNDRLKAIKAKLLEDHPTLKNEIECHCSYGHQIFHQGNKLATLIHTDGKESKQKADKLATYTEQFPWAGPVLEEIAIAQIRNAANKPRETTKKQNSTQVKIQEDRKRRAANKKKNSTLQLPIDFPAFLFPGDLLPTLDNSRPNRSKSTLSPTSHPCALPNQNSSDRFEIVIDESGSRFDADSNTLPLELGRLVAVVFGESSSNPPPLGTDWHSVKQHPHEIDRALETLIKKGVGVFGLTIDVLPKAHGDRWVDGVLMVIDWILRLLPIERETSISVHIENRSQFDAGQTWDAIARQAIKRLSLTFPQKASYITRFTIDILGKEDSSYLGYADAVAYTWLQSNAASRARLSASHLLGHCLHEFDSALHLRAWDQMARGNALSPEHWWELVCQSITRSSLTRAILGELGRESRETPELWTRFLDETRHQMAKSAVAVRDLGQAIDWLQTDQPENTSIPPMLRLVWLTTQLAKANHLGRAESQWEEELLSLAGKLIPENARLVAQADLHLAVARTNRFDFLGASQVLAKWQDMDPRIPGLLHTGQILSSLGQHAAFRGYPTEAIDYFDLALETFDQLSDPRERDFNKSITSTYRAIAMIDDPTQSDIVVWTAVDSVLGELIDQADELATSSDENERYHHHLLLRWLIHRGDQPTTTAYLSYRDRWHTGYGHPWPLIQLYRALLIYRNDADNARKLANRAAEMAADSTQGPVVHLIGLVCRRISHEWGGEWPEAADDQLDLLTDQLSAAADRLAILRDSLGRTTPPMELLTQVLPFNFR